MQDDLTFIRKYKKRKTPSGGTAKTSSSADSESTAMSEDGAGGDGDVADGDDDKKDGKVEAATVAAEMEVEDGTEVSGGYADGVPKVLK